MVSLPWCCTFQLLPLIRRRLPPFRLPASTDPHLGLRPFINHPVRGVLSPSCQRRGIQRGIPPCNPQRRREFDPVTNSEPFCASCKSHGGSCWGGLLWLVSPRGIDRQAVLSGPADRPSAGCLARFGSTADNRNEPCQPPYWTCLRYCRQEGLFVAPLSEVSLYSHMFCFVVFLKGASSLPRSQNHGWR